MAVQKGDHQQRSRKAKETLRMLGKNDVPQNLEYLHETEECSFFPLWHAVSRKTTTSASHGKEKERKSPQQMIVAGAIISGIERWRWGQLHKYRNGLMRPEITQYLIKITVELADILGVALDDIK